jgi:hypothetical protein
MSDSPQETVPVPAPRGYPLGTLFVLIAICAVLTAGAAPAIRAVANERLQWWQPLLAAGIAAGVMGFVGACMGGFYYPHWRGLLMGGIAGAGVGLFAGPLALVEPRELLPAVLAMCVGSVIAIALAAAMRRKGE